MGAFRDHPRRGAALAADTVRRSAFAVAAGAGAGFVLTVVAGVVGEEVFGSFEGDLDRYLRTGVGVVALVITVTLVIGGVAAAIAQSTYAQQLAREAEADPDSIAPRPDRAVLATDGPGGPVLAVIAIFLPIVLIALLLVVLADAETARYNPDDRFPAWVIPGIAALAVATVGVGVVSRRWWTPRWRSAGRRVGVIWTERALAAATADERGRRGPRRAAEFGSAHRALTFVERWGGRAAIAVGAIGGVLFFLGLFTRQQCRRCDPVYYDEPIEGAIDGVMSVAGPLIALSLVLAAIGALAAWLADVIAVATLRRLADAGAASPTAAQLLPVLTEATPAMAGSQVLLAVAWGLLPFAATAESIAPGVGFGPATAVLAVLGVIGIVGIARSEGSGAAMRIRLREAWHPGDPEPLGARVRTRTRRGVTRPADDGDADRGGDTGGDDA